MTNYLADELREVESDLAVPDPAIRTLARERLRRLIEHIERVGDQSDTRPEPEIRATVIAGVGSAYHREFWKTVDVAEAYLRDGTRPEIPPPTPVQAAHAQLLAERDGWGPA